VIPDLTEARATAEATLTDRCRITRTDSDVSRTVDPVTLALVTGPDDIIAANEPCSVSPSEAAGGGRSTAGATDALIDTHTVRLRSSAPAVKAGDAVTFTAVGPQGDPTLIDRTFVVRSVDSRSTLILRRLACVEAGPGDGVPT